jgi:hypothetical protein
MPAVRSGGAENSLFASCPRLDLRTRAIAEASSQEAMGLPQAGEAFVERRALRDDPPIMALGQRVE